MFLKFQKYSVVKKKKKKMDFKIRMTHFQITALFRHLNSTWQEHRQERTFSGMTLILHTSL